MMISHLKRWMCDMIFDAEDMEVTPTSVTR